MSKLCLIGLILVNIAIVTGRRPLAKIPTRQVGAARRQFHVAPIVATPVGAALPPPISARPGKYHAVPTVASSVESSVESGKVAGVASSEEASVESDIDVEVVPEDDKGKDGRRGKSNKICLLVANQVKALISLPHEKKRRGEAFMKALQKKITFLSLPDAKKGDVVKALKNIMELMPLADELEEEKEKLTDEKNKLADEKNKLADEKDDLANLKTTIVRKEIPQALATIIRTDKRKWVVPPGKSRITVGDGDAFKIPSSSQFPSLESLMRDLSALCHMEFKAEEEKKTGILVE